MFVFSPMKLHMIRDVDIHATRLREPLEEDSDSSSLRRLVSAAVKEYVFVRLECQSPS
jgi:hypothetical protein